MKKKQIELPTFLRENKIIYMIYTTQVIRDSSATIRIWEKGREEETEYFRTPEIN